MRRGIGQPLASATMFVAVVNGIVAGALGALVAEAVGAEVALVAVAGAVVDRPGPHREPVGSALPTRDGQLPASLPESFGSTAMNASAGSSPREDHAAAGLA